ncbi:DUF6625 family protein [Photobacterium piscicola]|uniref:DUF6625 family protein n=1 Tax=Photobacterium piscicola TaxID=1378299 RepID=UPI002E170140|nr:DUF6625 family protein [Photobacterium piscicola]
MKSCLLIPYFGKLPEWTSFFLKSCSKNNNYDFYIITDDKRKFEEYDNVKFIYYTFDDYCKQIRKKLHLKDVIYNYYKLNDIKPFLYFIHNDIIENYNYWGYCDIDLVFGNLDSFFKKYQDDNFYAISTHRDRFAGHFSLFKVNSFIEKCSPFKIPNWKKMLESEQHYGLEETSFGYSIFNFYILFGERLGRLFLKKAPKIVSNDYLYGRKFLLNEYYTTPLTPIKFWDKSFGKHHPVDWKWISGHIYSNKDNYEVPYLHFMNFKKSGWNIVEPLWGNETTFQFINNSKCFFINKKGLLSE